MAKEGGFPMTKSYDKKLKTLKQFGDPKKNIIADKQLDELSRYSRDKCDRCPEYGVIYPALFVVGHFIRKMDVCKKCKFDLKFLTKRMLKGRTRVVCDRCENGYITAKSGSCTNGDCKLYNGEIPYENFKKITATQDASETSEC